MTDIHERWLARQRLRWLQPHRDRLKPWVPEPKRIPQLPDKHADDAQHGREFETELRR